MEDLNFNDDAAEVLPEHTKTEDVDVVDVDSEIESLLDLCDYRPPNLDDAGRKHIIGFLSGRCGSFFNSFALKSSEALYDEVKNFYYVSPEKAKFPKELLNILTYCDNVHEVTGACFDFFHSQDSFGCVYSLGLDDLVGKIRFIPTKYLGSLTRLQDLVDEVIGVLDKMNQKELDEALMPKEKNEYVGFYRRLLGAECKWVGRKTPAYAAYLVAAHCPLGIDGVPTIGELFTSLADVIEGPFDLNDSLELVVYLVFGSVFGTKVSFGAEKAVFYSITHFILDCLQGRYFAKLLHQSEIVCEPVWRSKQRSFEKYLSFGHF